MRNPALLCLLVLLLVAGCSNDGNKGKIGKGVGMSDAEAYAKAKITSFLQTSVALSDQCPKVLTTLPHCLTPHALRVAYGVEPLIRLGYTGKGQTIVDIVSYGSPTLQQIWTCSIANLACR